MPPRTKASSTSARATCRRRCPRSRHCGASSSPGTSSASSRATRRGRWRRTSHWVHGVDRLRIAKRLSDQRPFHAPPLNVCLQVNVGGESTKGGVAPAELPELARAVAALPRIALRGLMCIPPPEDDPARQRHWFSRDRARCCATLHVPGTTLDTLSMGMSDRPRNRHRRRRDDRARRHRPVRSRDRRHRADR